MTAYSSYVKDFPSRCGEILAGFESSALELGRDVTLLLSISTTALIFPHDRLKCPRPYRHPSGDRDRHPRAARQYEQLLDNSFLSSPLWGKPGASTWRKGKVQNVGWGGPDSWPELRAAEEMKPEARVSEVLRILRNALAHGNVFTEGMQIRNIVFLTWDGRKAAKFISVSPQDFRSFMMKYIRFVSSLKLDA